MKKLIKVLDKWANDNDVVYWVRFALWAFLIVWFIYTFKQGCNSPKNSIDTSLAPVNHYKDKNGEEHSQITSNVLSQEEMKRITDSLRKTIKGRVVIKEVTKYVQSIDAEFNHIPLYYDSNQNFSFTHSDNYISLSAWGNTQDKDANISLKAIDTLQYTSYLQKRFLASNKRKVDITNKSPYNTITAGNSYTTREPKSLIVIGPSITWTPFNTQKWAIGISVTANIFSLKTKR